jgi:hypothetical protein
LYTDRKGRRNVRLSNSFWTGMVVCSVQNLVIEFFSLFSLASDVEDGKIDAITDYSIGGPALFFGLIGFL